MEDTLKFNSDSGSILSITGDSSRRIFFFHGISFTYTCESFLVLTSPLNWPSSFCDMGSQGLKDCEFKTCGC